MADQSRWPITLGTIGIVLGALLILDNLDDFFTLQWTAEDWGRLFAPAIAEAIGRWMPPAAWRLLSALVEVALGALLVAAGVNLRRRHGRGVRLARVWAGLAVVWVGANAAWAAWWLARHGWTLPELGAVGWRGFTVFVLVFTVGIMLAFPVFLLLWLANPNVRAECRSWPR